jgi:hypothetical protein
MDEGGPGVFAPQRVCRRTPASSGEREKMGRGGLEGEETGRGNAVSSQTELEKARPESQTRARQNQSREPEARATRQRRSNERRQRGPAGPASQKLAAAAASHDKNKRGEMVTGR